MASDDDDKKHDWKGLLSGIALQILLFPASALLLIWMASSTWHWYLEPRFGPGPTAAEWFGIAMLHTIITYEIRDADKDKYDEKAAKGAVRFVLQRFAERNITLVIAFGVSAAIATLMGWR